MQMNLSPNDIQTLLWALVLLISVLLLALLLMWRKLQVDVLETDPEPDPLYLGNIDITVHDLAAGLGDLFALYSSRESEFFGLQLYRDGSGCIFRSPLVSEIYFDEMPPFEPIIYFENFEIEKAFRLANQILRGKRGL